jgi:hypothetical protein
MRIVVFTAALLLALVLVDACSSSNDDGQADQYRTLTPVPSKSTSPSPTQSTTTVPSPVPRTPPAAGAPIAQVIAWIGAEPPVETDGFHTASRDGVTTQLGEDVAFVTQDGKSKCMTDTKYSDGALACLVSFDGAPPRPIGAEGEWIGGWVDFDGPTVQIGSLHGDPGRFVAGNGPELGAAQSLKFGDYQCRSDATGLYCANLAHRSAVRLSNAGVETFGCLQRVDAPVDVGTKYACE